MSAMKKIFEKLKKPIKKDGSVFESNQLCKDAVPDAPRDLKSDVPLREEMYKNFRIENSCKSIEQSEQNCGRSNSDGMSSLRETDLNFFQLSSLNSEAVPVVDVCSRPRSISAPQESTENVLAESHRLRNGLDFEGLRSNVIGGMHECGSVSGSESSSESENNAPSGNEGSSLTVRNSRNSSLEQKRPKQKKNNTYVINISNSKHFQIGSQKNVFVNGTESGSLKIKNLKSNEIEQKNLNPQNDLLKVTRPITTQELTKIATHINSNWEEIGKNLGITQSEIEEIIMVNDNNSNIIAFDMFKRFLARNPETSVAFVADVLMKSNQYRAIQELAP